MMTNQEMAQRAQEVTQFQPANPVEMERRITQANDLLDALVEAQLDTNNRRYSAEAAYVLQKNTRMTFWMNEGKNVTYARAQAEVESQEQFEAWNSCKAEYHHLEDLSQALRTRIYSWLNINKSVQAAYNSHRGT